MPLSYSFVVFVAVVLFVAVGGVGSAGVVAGGGGVVLADWMFESATSTKSELLPVELPPRALVMIHVRADPVSCNMSPLENLHQPNPR